MGGPDHRPRMIWVRGNQGPAGSVNGPLDDRIAMYAHLRQRERERALVL